LLAIAVSGWLLIGCARPAKTPILVTKEAKTPVCVERVDCSEPVAVDGHCGDVVTECTGQTVACACAEGLECVRQSCRVPPEPDPECRPDRSNCHYRLDSPCGQVETQCPGVFVECGCNYGLSCAGGYCVPPQRACDPVSF
jgi:hypothetical protein